MENQPQKISILQKLLGKSAPAIATPTPTSAGGVAPIPVPPPSAGATPASSAPAAATQTTAGGNAFTKLFGVSNGISTSAPNGAKSSALPSIASLLGPKPLFSRRDMEEQEQKITKVAKFLFRFSIVAAIGIYGFFYSQLESDFTLLSSQFGPNVAVQFDRSNAELQKTQTELNLVHFRLARLMLDEINSQIDARTAQKNTIISPASSESMKNTAREQLTKVEAEIKQNLSSVQKIFAQARGIDTFSRVPVSTQEREEMYTKLLKDELQKKRTALGADAKPNRDEIRLIDNVIRLVDNTSFQGMIKSKDFGKISNTDLDTVLTKIREEGTDQLSSIEKIRKQRINWAKIIADINGVTRKADLYYGQGLFKTVGGFLFSSYRFDAKTSRISIAGVTKTADNKTFSFIAKLVDSIEKSPQFKDIDFRSFSKSRDETGDYSSSINLEFSLQSAGVSDPRDDTGSDTTAVPGGSATVTPSLSSIK